MWDFSRSRWNGFFCEATEKRRRNYLLLFPTNVLRGHFQKRRFDRTHPLSVPWTDHSCSSISGNIRRNNNNNNNAENSIHIKAVPGINALFAFDNIPVFVFFFFSWQRHTDVCPVHVPSDIVRICIEWFLLSSTLILPVNFWISAKKKNFQTL